MSQTDLTEDAVHMHVNIKLARYDSI